jgi:hypothetical protein
MQPYKQVLYHYASVALRYIDGWNVFPAPTKCWCRVLKIKKEQNLNNSPFLRNVTGRAKEEECMS